MNIMRQMDELASVLLELTMKDKNHIHVKEFIQSCGDVNIQKVWNSLTDEQQRTISDELYYHLRFNHV